MLHLLLLFRWKPTNAECSRMQSCGEAVAMWKDQGPWTAWVQLPALPLLSSVALGKLLTDGSLRFIWKMEVMIPVSVIVRIKWDKNGISSSRAWMWELDYKETWAPKNWCLWTVVLEKSLESPLNCKEIKPVHLKGNQSWIFIGRMLKLKFQYFGHLVWRTDSLGKILMLGKIEGRKRRGWQRIR